MALSLGKMIVEIKDAVKDNMDAVERRIASTGAQLLIVEDTQISSWGPNDPERRWLKKFEETLEEELTKLCRLSGEEVLRKIADHEDEKSQIATILERVNEARMQFELYTNIRMLSVVKTMEQAAMQSIINNLRPSHMADYKYYLEGNQREALRRELCTPGTRLPILGEATTWANDTSLESEPIFWSFGPAGSGKTTIAYTIARRFESTFDTTDTITLGGNFLCSRQFEETRFKTYIIRTLAYQLARKCQGFAEALNRTENFDSIHRDVGTQLQSPNHPVAAVSIDARPRLVERNPILQGGSEFLRDLLTVINNNRLPSLKFFVTSRPDPDIVSRAETLERKQLIRLQDVGKGEVQRDIATYLEANLPRFKGREEMRNIQEFAGDLFIVAATIVRHLTLKKNNFSEQKGLLQKLFPRREGQRATSTSATHLLDNLYVQILNEAFDQFSEEFFADKLNILHTFLCAMERTSTSIVTKLLDLEDPDGPVDTSTNPANDVLSCLHAVLYVDQNHSVLSYHKSFIDFIFDKNRSGKFACNQPSHHQLLTQHCFRIMNTGLKFNIANIATSFIFDTDNPDLQNEVTQNLSLELSYSCRSWSRHLPLTQPSLPFLDPLSDFLQLPVLFWIEAMNLLNASTQCYLDLCRASEWVETHEDGAALAQQLRDTRAPFARRFRFK